MKNKQYKQIPELKTEQEYANFWNSVEDATEYLDPKRFKAISLDLIVQPIPSVASQIEQVRKLAKKYGTSVEQLLHVLIQAGIRSVQKS